MYSTQQIADLLDVQRWQIGRLFETGVLPEPERFAGSRVIPKSMIPSVVDALKKKGWLPSPNQEVTA